MTTTFAGNEDNFSTKFKEFHQGGIIDDASFTMLHRGDNIIPPTYQYQTEWLTEWQDKPISINFDNKTYGNGKIKELIDTITRKMELEFRMRYYQYHWKPEPPKNRVKNTIKEIYTEYKKTL